MLVSRVVKSALGKLVVPLSPVAVLLCYIRQCTAYPGFIWALGLLDPFLHHHRVQKAVIPVSYLTDLRANEFLGRFMGYVPVASQTWRF